MASEHTLEAVVALRERDREGAEAEMTEASTKMAAATVDLSDAQRAFERGAEALRCLHDELDHARTMPATIGDLQNGQDDERGLQEILGLQRDEVARCQRRFRVAQAGHAQARDRLRETLAAVEIAEHALSDFRRSARRANEERSADEADELAGTRAFVRWQR